MITTNAEPLQSAVCASGTGHSESYHVASYMEAPTDGNDVSRYADLGPDEDKEDSTICWYPMRIRHSSTKKAFDVRQSLYDHGFNTYLRLEYHEEVKHEELRQIAKPVFNNLIFVQVRKKIIRQLKNTDRNLLPLQFMTMAHRDKSQRSVILTVPDRDMYNFIAAETRDDPYHQRQRWVYDDALAKPGRKVRILRGPFAGIKGEIKNFKTHRIVIVKLSDLGLANAITRIPKKDLEFYEDFDKPE